MAPLPSRVRRPSEMAPLGPAESRGCASARDAEIGKERRFGSGFRGAGLSMVATPRGSTGKSWPSQSSAPIQAPKGYAAPSAAAQLPQPLSQPREECKPAKVPAPTVVPAPTAPSRSPEPDAIEKTLGRLALHSPESVDVASRLVDMAVAKVGKSRFKDLYEAKAVALSGRIGRAGDFGNDNMIQDFARVWQEQAFEEAVQVLCVDQGFARGQWNVATSTDYPGQPAQREARFALHWAVGEKSIVA